MKKILTSQDRFLNKSQKKNEKENKNKETIYVCVYTLVHTKKQREENYLFFHTFNRHSFSVSFHYTHIHLNEMNEETQ